MVPLPLIHAAWGGREAALDQIEGNFQARITEGKEGASHEGTKRRVKVKWENVRQRESEVKVWVAQSCPTLCNPMDCRLSVSSVQGILQVRILEWVAIPFYTGSFWPMDFSWVSCTVGRFFTIWMNHQAGRSRQRDSEWKHSGLRVSGGRKEAAMPEAQRA